jgi:hypothetical protein
MDFSLLSLEDFRSTPSLSFFTLLVSYGVFFFFLFLFLFFIFFVDFTRSRGDVDINYANKMPLRDSMKYLVFYCPRRIFQSFTLDYRDSDRKLSGYLLRVIRFKTELLAFLDNTRTVLFFHMLQERRLLNSLRQRTWKYELFLRKFKRTVNEN